MSFIIDYKPDDEGSYFQLSENLVRSIQSEIKELNHHDSKDYITLPKALASQTQDFARASDNLGSPIEALFFWECVFRMQALNDTMNDLAGSDTTNVFLCNAGLRGSETLSIMGFEIQHEIRYQKQVFRVDFLFHIEKKTINPDKSFSFEYHSLIVELDGHEFHEKTKEQAQRDRFRDRCLKQSGHDVIHFTGTEVYRSPQKVFDEVRNYIVARFS